MRPFSSSPETPLTASAGPFRFGPFQLDVAQRRLTRAGEPVHLATRYFDLLVALVQRAGHLAPRDTLFAEVWHDVVVGDAALAQGIRTLRRALGDDAAQPHYIETVAGHGYRFIASVEIAETAEALPRPATVAPARRARVQPGMVGGAVAGGLASGLLGGLLYGAAYAAASPHPAATLVSVVLFGAVVGVVGATGVFGGAYAGSLWRPAGAWPGAVVGGGLVGLAGEFVGRSVLGVLTGLPVGDLTGGVEGLLVGAALGLGPLLFQRRARPVETLTLTALATLAALALVAAMGRPFFAASLVAVLRPADVQGLLPAGLTLPLRLLLAALEGLMYGLCCTAGMLRMTRPVAAPPA